MENNGDTTSNGNTSANGYHRRSKAPTPLKHQDGRPLESPKLANKEDFKRQQPSKNTRRSAQKIPLPKSPAPCPPLRVLQMAQAWDGTGPHPFPSGSSRERLFRAANDFNQGMVIARRIFTRIVNESGSVSLNVSTGGLAKITSALLCDKRSFYFGSWDDAKNLAKAIQGDTMMKGAIGMSVPVDEAIRIMKKMLIHESWNVVKIVFEATVAASITLGYLKVWHDCKRGQETLNGVALIRRALSLIKYGWLQLDPHEKNYRVRGNTFKPSFERSCRVLLIDAILCGYSNTLDNTLFPLTDALAEAEKILVNCQNACNNEVLSEGFQMCTYYKAHLATAYRTKAIVAYHKANEAKIGEEERIILFDVAIQNYALAAQYLPCDDLDKAMHLWVISESLFKRGGTTIIEIKRIVEEAIACEEAGSSVFGDLGVYTPKLYTMRCFKNILTQGQSCNDDTILPSNWDEPNWLQDKDFGRFVVKALDEYKKDKEETVKRARLFAAIHI